MQTFAQQPAKAKKPFSDAMKVGNISDSRIIHLHLKARQLLDNGRVMDAWKVLLM